MPEDYLTSVCPRSYKLFTDLADESSIYLPLVGFCVTADVSWVINACKAQIYMYPTSK